MSSGNFSASRDEQLAAVLASPPPRVLPRPLRRAALQLAAPLSFGIFGAVFGGFGLLFVWIFFPRNIVQDWRLRSPDIAQGSGTILAAVDTRVSVNRTKIVLYGFEFRTTAGVLRRGECFTTGQRWQRGDSVQVAYVPDRPSIACPIGARLSRTSMASLFVIFFPLGGGGLVAWVLISRGRILNTFRHGQVIEAFVTDIEHTQTMINDYSLIKITFEPPDAPQREPIILRHWKPKVVAFLQMRREAGQPVLLLRDPRKPANFFLPEAL